MPLARLDNGALGRLTGAIARPAYDRDLVAPGIVHLGVGAFHRAHQAVYTDAAMATGDGRWGIIGASLRAPNTRDALAPQDGLYTVAVRDGSDERLQVVGAIMRLLVAPEAPARLLGALAAPTTLIVTITVTEKGYCHDPATGTLVASHPDIARDLAHPTRPRSLPGVIVEALRLRRLAGLPPFTVLSCDNLPANGVTTKRVLADFGRLRDPDLGAFIEAELACPSTMVDRIVPATTDEDRARISKELGFEDRWPVVTEPFSIWIIEDHFPQGRPDWAVGGAIFARDVEPWERMKLRLLNGAHSGLAYLGYLAGRETVAQAIADAGIRRFVEGLWDEAEPTLTRPDGADIGSFRRDLLTRFANPALKHRTWQIAMDGSQKLPQRLLGTIRDRLAAGAPIANLALAVAGWMRYVAGMDERGAPIDVRDPLADRFRALAAAAGAPGPIDPQRLAEGLLGIEAIFGPDLPRDPRFTGPVTAALTSLVSRGARATLAAPA